MIRKVFEQMMGLFTQDPPESQVFLDSRKSQKRVRDDGDSPGPVKRSKLATQSAKKVRKGVTIPHNTGRLLRKKDVKPYPVSRMISSSNQNQGTWPPEKLRIWTKDTMEKFSSVQSVNACRENNSMFYECVHDDECDNQTITRLKAEDIQLDVFGPDARGYGLETSSDIIKDQAIIEVTGKVIFGPDPENKYTIALKERIKKRKVYIDTDGELVGWMNHSCSPNCRIEEWVVAGYVRLVVLAERNISAKEELTFDYGDKMPNIMQFCLCGSEICRKPKPKNHNDSDLRTIPAQPQPPPEHRQASCSIQEPAALSHEAVVLSHEALVPLHDATAPSYDVEDGGRTDDNKYCTCKGKWDGRDMIMCDDRKCKYQWFHFDCVGLIAKPNRDKWFCNTCIYLSGHSDYSSVGDDTEDE